MFGIKNEVSDSKLPDNPLQYEVGEVCKCFFTEIEKNPNNMVSQQINKCQSFCRIIEKNPDEQKEYTVVLFDGKKTTKKLPGRCLRKVKLVPYTYKEAVATIGKLIETSDASDKRVATMVVACVEDEDGDDGVMINNMEPSEMMNDFQYVDTGAPYCNIVMMKADEAFSGSSYDD